MSDISLPKIDQNIINILEDTCLIEYETVNNIDEPQWSIAAVDFVCILNVIRNGGDLNDF